MTSVSACMDGLIFNVVLVLLCSLQCETLPSETGVEGNKGAANVRDTVDVRDTVESYKLEEQGKNCSVGTHRDRVDTGDVLLKRSGEEMPSRKQDTKVPPPINIQMLFINISSVKIFWDYPSSDDPLPINFMVRVSHDGGPYIDASGLLKEAWFVYGTMVVAGYYQFQVLAYFEDIASGPTATDYFVNGITAPPGPPMNVDAIIVSPTDLSLQWDGPETPTPLFYIVYWGEDRSDLKNEERLYQTTHFSFQNLEPESTLYFQLRTDISGRLSILSDALSVTMPSIEF